MIIKILYRYIILSIISSTLVVLLALISIDMLGKIIAEIDIVGEKTYTFGLLMIYVLGLIPLKLILFFPIALLIGALIGMGKIASMNELTVMQNLGVSRLRIAFLGFFVSVIMGAIVLFIADFVGIDLNKKVNEIRSYATGESYNSYSSTGIWVQDGNRFINIKNIKSNGQLSNITIYGFDNSMKLNKIIFAKEATFKPNSWILNTAIVKEFNSKGILSKSYNSLEWGNNISTDIIGLLLIKPKELSIKDLYKYKEYQKANNMTSTTYELEFWQRILIPISTGAMFLLSLPFVFGSQRNSSQGKKLFIGILLGIIYYVSYQSIASIVLLTGAPVVWGAISPILLFSLVGLLLLRIRV